MSNVQRYDYNPYRQCIGPQFNGEYVSFDDYESLRAENAKLAKLYEAAWAECEAWRDAYDRWDGNPNPARFMRPPTVQCDATDAARKDAGL